MLFRSPRSRLSRIEGGASAGGSCGGRASAGKSSLSEQKVIPRQMDPETGKLSNWCVVRSSLSSISEAESVVSVTPSACVRSEELTGPSKVDPKRRLAEEVRLRLAQLRPPSVEHAHEDPAPFDNIIHRQQLVPPLRRPTRSQRPDSRHSAKQANGGPWSAVRRQGQ